MFASFFWEWFSTKLGHHVCDADGSIVIIKDKSGSFP